MEKIFEIIWKVSGIVAPIIATVIRWVGKNKEKIEALILRVQKDAKDGLTKVEMEQILVDLFFQEVYVKLPWYAKILGRKFWEKKVRKIAKKFCAKSHEIKVKRDGGEDDDGV